MAKEKKKMSKKKKVLFWIAGFFVLISFMSFFTDEEATTKLAEEEPKQEKKAEPKEEEKEAPKEAEKEAPKEAEKAPEKVTVKVVSHERENGKTHSDKTEYKVKTLPEATVKVRTQFIDTVLNEYTEKADSKGIATFTVDTPRTEEGDANSLLVYVQAEKAGKKSKELEALIIRYLTEDEELEFYSKQAKPFNYAQFEKDPNNLDLMTTHWKLTGSIESETSEGDYLISVGGNTVLVMVPDSAVKKGLIKKGSNVEVVATGNGTYFENGNEYIALVADYVKIK